MRPGVRQFLPELVVLQCDRRSARLGIQAPEQTGIFREELVVLQASEDSADASRP